MLSALLGVSGRSPLQHFGVAQELTGVELCPEGRLRLGGG